MEVASVVVAGASVVVDVSSVGMFEGLVSMTTVRVEVEVRPRAHWPFRINSRDISVSIPGVIVCNDADVAIESCTKGLELGSFLSYMVAPLRKSGRLKYVLEDIEIEPVPVRFVYRVPE